MRESPVIFQNLWEYFRISGNISESPGIFEDLREYFRISGNISESLETLLRNCRNLENLQEPIRNLENVTTHEQESLEPS